MMKSLRGATSLPIRSFEHPRRILGIRHTHATEGAVLAAHRGLRKLVGIHLPQPLVALNRVLVLLAGLLDGLQHRVQLGLGVGVDHLVRLRPRVHHDHPMQRGNGGEDPARVDHRAHVAEEQREQQRSDVGAVDIRVGHDDDLAVSGLLEVERPSRTGTDHLNDRGALRVAEHVAHRRLLNVEDLAADRQQGLELAVAPELRRAQGGVALDDEQFGSVDVVRPAVDEFGRQ